MKQYVLPVLALFILASCSTDEGSRIDPNAPVEVDQFFVRFMENGQISSIESSSYTKKEHYTTVSENAFENGEAIGNYFGATVNNTGLYEMENVATAKVDFSMSKWTDFGNSRLENLYVEIISSNQKEIICNQEDVLIEEIFQEQNNSVYELRLTPTRVYDLLSTNFDLALFNVSYNLLDPVSQSEKIYKSFASVVSQTNLYAQPTDSFFNVSSVTESIHVVESLLDPDFDLETYNYNYIIEGNAKVRVFNVDNPENDYKDLEFTFKIPSRKLVPFSIICN